MSKKFRIAKRISMEDIDHFEDVEVDDDFVDNEMVQIIADNEYDPMYDDCESIAVALQLAGYGKISDLKAKLAESKSKLRVSNSSVASSQLEYNKLKKEYDEQEKLLSQKLASNSTLQFEYDKLKQQLVEKEKKLNILAFRISDLHEENLSFQIVEEENEQLKERWNKLKEYLNKQKENFKKMLPTGYASNEMLGKLCFSESILKTMKNLEKGIKENEK